MSGISARKSRFRVPENLSRSVFIRWKSFLQRVRPVPDKKNYLFIFGCQRSGTTLMSQIFEKDIHTRSFGEKSDLSYRQGDERLRLLPIEEVRKTLAAVRAPFIVMKPLVESQRANELLREFENSKALWLYRDFRDVASSNIRRFGPDNGVRDLAAIAHDKAGDWRAQHISAESRQLVIEYFSTSMKPFDAAVLFWIVRNRIYFENGLDGHPDVMLCRYENLAQKPAEVMKQIYRFAGQAYPGDQIVADTHARSVRKGAEIDLSPQIVDIATHLLEKLNAVCDTRDAENESSASTQGTGNQ